MLPVEESSAEYRVGYAVLRCPEVEAAAVVKIVYLVGQEVAAIYREQHLSGEFIVAVAAYQIEADILVLGEGRVVKIIVRVALCLSCRVKAEYEVL